MNRLDLLALLLLTPAIILGMAGAFTPAFTFAFAALAFQFLNGRITLISLPSFTRSQLNQARGLTWHAAETVVAAALDIPVRQLRQWRHDGTGPDYETTVNGQTIYRRDTLLAFIARHLKK